MLNELNTELPTEFILHEKIWKVGEFLGEGAFSVVHEISSDGENNCAGKFTKIPLKKKGRLMLIRELMSMKKCEHPNIVKFLGYTKLKDYHVLRLELCSNKNMFYEVTKNRGLPEKTCIYYISQLLKGLEYLHSKNIIHRDIKSANIYLHTIIDGEIQKNMLKLGDFGMACCLENVEELHNEVMGTPNCIAPEVLRCSKKLNENKDELTDDSNQKHGYSFSADIWSAGVCLYFWFYAKHPFETSNIESTYSRILSGVYYFPDFNSHYKIISQDMRDFIKSFLILDEKKRANATQLLFMEIMN